MRGEPANGATLCTIPAGVKKEAATLVGLGSQPRSAWRPRPWGGAEEEEGDRKRVLLRFSVWKGKEGQKTTDRRDGAHGPSDVEGREEGAKK